MPHERADAPRHDWSNFLDGGKDGLFLVVVSLGWWLHAQDPEVDSKIDVTIADVTWVLNNLVSFLSADAIAGSESPRNTPSPIPKKKRPEPRKINLSAKGARS